MINAQRRADPCAASSAGKGEDVGLAVASAGVDVPCDVSDGRGVPRGQSDMAVMVRVQEGGDLPSVVLCPGAVLMLEHPVGDHAAETVLVERAENFEGDVQDPA